MTTYTQPLSYVCNTIAERDTFSANYPVPEMTVMTVRLSDATNSPTDAPTNYGVLAAILGADANSTNAKQNATAANVNALATKFNTLLTTLRANGIIGT